MEPEIVVAGSTETQSEQHQRPQGHVPFEAHNSDAEHRAEPSDVHAAEHHDEADDLVVLERLEADLAEIDRELQALNASPAT